MCLVAVVPTGAPSVRNKRAFLVQLVKMIQKLEVINFRNFAHKLIKFPASTTVVAGPNASGKTNLLESIHLLSTGKSFRAEREFEMINYDQEIARIKARVGEEEESEVLEVVLTTGQLTAGAKLKVAPRKKLLVDGVGKRLMDFAGRFPSVLFSPQDMDLVTSSPSVRRQFFNAVLTQTDREYRRSFLAYEKGIKRRNRLLFAIREGAANRNQLTYWDMLLIKNGDTVTRLRQELVEYINRQSGLSNREFELQYSKNLVTEERLNKYAEAEVAAAQTLVGPHRDDFVFMVKNGSSSKFRELARFGSRGEARLAVLWLKLSEFAFIADKTHKEPTLLLDDILSELDEVRREAVLEVVAKHQTIITTAEDISDLNLSNVEKISLGG